MIPYRGGVALLVFFHALVALSDTASGGASKTLSEPRPPVFYLGLGVVSQNLKRLAGDEAGHTALNPMVFPALSLITRFKTKWPDWVLSGSLSYTPFGHVSPEGGEKTVLIPAVFGISRTLGRFDPRLGMGVLFSKISGSGGTSTQKNGNSESTFGLPAYSSTSYSMLVDLGMGVEYQNFRCDLDGLVNGLLSSRRALTLLVSLSYGFI